MGEIPDADNGDGYRGGALSPVGALDGLAECARGRFSIVKMFEVSVEMEVIVLSPWSDARPKAEPASLADMLAISKVV